MFSQYQNQATSLEVHFVIGVLIFLIGLLLAAFAAPTNYGLLLVAIGIVPLRATLLPVVKNSGNYNQMTPRLTLFNG